MSPTTLRYRYSNVLYDPIAIAKGGGLSDNWAALGDSIGVSTVANQRLGLHVTSQELAIWQSRAASGPYKTAGDVSTNSPGDWTDIVSRKNSFNSSPTTDRWAGNTTGTCWTPSSTAPSPA